MRRAIESIRIKSNQFISIGTSYYPGPYFAELVLQTKKYSVKLINQ